VDGLEAGQKPSRDPQVDGLGTGQKDEAGPEGVQAVGGEVKAILGVNG